MHLSSFHSAPISLVINPLDRPCILIIVLQEPFFIMSAWTFSRLVVSCRVDVLQIKLRTLPSKSWRPCFWTVPSWTGRLTTLLTSCSRSRQRSDQPGTIWSLVLMLSCAIGTTRGPDVDMKVKCFSAGDLAATRGHVQPVSQSEGAVWTENSQALRRRFAESFKSSGL